jgi:hypothetical protein
VASHGLTRVGPRGYLVVRSSALVPREDPAGRSVKPEEVRAEILRLEQERLRIAPEVMGGDYAALEKDKRLERRIMELASAEREARSSELMEGWRRRHSDEEDKKGSTG